MVVVEVVRMTWDPVYSKKDRAGEKDILLAWEEDQESVMTTPSPPAAGFSAILPCSTCLGERMRSSCVAPVSG